jgi:hypothetical protein
MTGFARGFKLHLRSGQVLDGAAFPSGRAIIVDDPEYGLASAAISVEELLKGYHRARIEWDDDALPGERPTVDTINSNQLDALVLQAARMRHAVEQYAKLRVQLEDAQAAVARVRALADNMRTWCSPHGIATDYAGRIDEALAQPKET